MGAVQFPSTVWKTIELAQASDTEATGRLIERYRPPIVQFALNRGLQPADSEDVAHVVFQRILEKKLLQAADASRGRFRSLILAITRHVISERARQKTPLPLETLVAATDREEEFDRLWALNLMHKALERLKEESAARQTPYYEALMAASKQDATLRAIGERMGKSERDIRNYVHRAKELLRKYYAQAIRDYASSEDEYIEEHRYLQEYFS